jgi:hypothetical protein
MPFRALSPFSWVLLDLEITDQVAQRGSIVTVRIGWRGSAIPPPSGQLEVAQSRRSHHPALQHPALRGCEEWPPVFRHDLMLSVELDRRSGQLRVSFVTVPTRVTVPSGFSTIAEAMSKSLTGSVGQAARGGELLLARHVHVDLVRHIEVVAVDTRWPATSN